MDVKTLCLGVLSEGEATGYDIKKYFECTFSHFFVAGFGSIYPALADLTKQGLVTCREEAQDNRPDRKVYSLTEKGRAAFVESLEQTPPRHKIRSEFMVLLHFAHLLPRERVAAIIDQRLGDLTRDLQLIERFFQETKNGECHCEPGQEFGVGMVYEALKASRDFIVARRDAFLDHLDQHAAGSTQQKRA
ncbi:MAG: PadR family transcriptional regulator [Gammaproteobacteria bacterium]|nr:PadR family transcriptional regulator [Gammaproteobacteria bacterium]